LLCGLAAYGLWGLIPLYFKSVAGIAPLEVLAHRALWSCVMLVLLIGWRGRWAELRRELRSPKLLAMLALTSLLIAANWLTFIYAVISRQLLQASLGYFVNPLVSVLLGVVFLRERLRPYQMASIALAIAGVIVLAAMVGQLPWISLTLALSFALYGLLRKLMPVDGMVSLAVETFVMAPFAVAYLGYLAASEQITGYEPPAVGLLMLSGPVTTVPLLFFGAAARRLRLSTLGILQYVTPTGHFLLAVLAFGESFSTPQLLSFACIWTAVAIYTVDSYRAARQAGIDLIEPFGTDE
jgi:chloramphenicol-sensitive protein RarD